MVDNVSSNFSDLLIIEERIEVGLRSGKIVAGVNGNSLAKKVTFDKKKGDTNAIMTTKTEQSTYCPIFRTNQFSPCFQPTATVRPSFTPPPTSTTTTTKVQNTQPGNSQRRSNPRVFTPILMSYAELLPHLIQQSFIVVVPVKPLVPPYPKNYDPTAKCDHMTPHRKCWGLKHKVQDLIDIEWLNFKENTPNINNNPLPEYGKLAIHDKSSINAIIKEEDGIERIEEVRTPMRFIFKKLIQYEVIMEGTEIGIYPGDDRVRTMVQRLINLGIVQVSRRDTEALITMIRAKKEAGNGPKLVIIK
ncbi:hypothetical protein CR513_45010, partial [Mucuna pruriens]